MNLQEDYRTGRQCHGKMNSQRHDIRGRQYCKKANSEEQGNMYKFFRNWTLFQYEGWLTSSLPKMRQDCLKKLKQIQDKF